MTKILPRRGTATQWAAANPILAMGELGYETDTKKSKRGDGVTAWNALAYGGDQNLSAYAPLDSPAFTGTPTGITKEHVGLGNVDNTSDAAKPVSTAQATAINAKYTKPGGGIPSSDIADNSIINAKLADDAVGIAELSATGAPSATTFLRGDNTWATPSGGGSDATIDLWHDFTNDANGPVGNADSGQPWTLTWSRAASQPVIASGRYVINDTAAGSAAGYITTQLSSSVIYVEAEFDMTSGSTSGQRAAIVLWESPLGAGLLAGTNRSPCHIIFGPNGYDYQTYDSGAGGAYNVGAVSYGDLPGTSVQKVAIALVPSKNTAFVRGPDGKVSTFVDAKIGSVTAQYSCAEIFYTAANTDGRVRYSKFRAASSFTTVENSALQTKYDSLVAVGSNTGSAPASSGGAGRVAAPTGDAATDTAAIQAAHDALPVNGGSIFLDRGDYYLTATGVVFTKSVHLIGHGAAKPDSQALTNLVSNSATATAITCNVENCRIDNVSVVNISPGPVTSGAGIRMQKSHNACIQNVHVWGFYDNISVEAGNYWSILNSHVMSPWRYGIRIRNADNADSGDMLLSGIWFDLTGITRNPDAAVRWETGGGMRVSNCKINGGPTYKFVTGIDCAFTGNGDAADIFVIGNSIENLSGSAVKLVRSSGSNTVTNVQVINNETMTAAAGVEVGVGFKSVVVDGNLGFNLTTGINLLDGASQVTVGGSNRWSLTTTPVLIGSAAYQDIQVAPQHRNGDGVVVTDNADGLIGAAAVTYDYMRPVDFTVTSTPVSLFAVNLSNYGSGFIDVVLSGVHNGTGGFSLRRRVGYVVDGAGAVTVTDVDTSTVGSTGPQLTFTTSPGGLSVAVSTTDGQSVIGGKANIKIDGRPAQFRIGA